MNNTGLTEAVSGLGDLNGDSVPDLVVGHAHDDDGGFNRGAVWILFLNRDGTVKSEQKISDLQGNFTGGLRDDDRFGYGLSRVEELDHDGTKAITVGAVQDNNGTGAAV